MRTGFLSLAFVLLAVPLGAGAQAAWSWDFQGKPADGWQAQDIEGAQSAADGLHLKIAPQGGGILRPVSFGVRPESFVIRVRSERDTKGFLLWHLRGAPKEESQQLPFQLDASASMKEIQVPLSYYRTQWTKDADMIGIFFDGGAEVTIASAGFRSYALSEKAIELVKGLWTFDEFRPYSINFLWGPLLSYTPAMRDTLYDTLPPYAHSATQWMYALLGVCLTACLVFSATRSPRALPAFGVLCAVFAGLWVLFDIRMGAEVLSYAKRDLTEYALAPEGEKRLRTHQGIFDTLNEALPELTKHERFGLVTVEDAFYSLIRYRAYPSLPMTPDRSQSGVTLWLVAYRDDASINGSGRLVVGEKVLSSPGRIVKRFDERSYLFSTEP